MDRPDKEPSPSQITKEWLAMADSAKELERQYAYDKENFASSRQDLEFITNDENEIKRSFGKLAQNFAFSTAMQYDDAGRQLAKALGAKVIDNDINQDGEPLPPYYDIVARLTEKDADGNYLVSDDMSAKFLKWYGHTALRIQEDIRLQALAIFETHAYERGVDRLIAADVLPGIFEDAKDKLSAKISDTDEPLDFFIFDYAGRKDFAAGVYGKKHKASDEGRAIGLNIGGVAPGRSDSWRATLIHEMTHFVEGKRMDYGNSIASRCMDEAMTESVAFLINEAIDGREDFSELPFGAYGSYEEEREVLRMLQKGNGHSINPQLFYMAYLDDSMVGSTREFLKDELKWAFGKDDFAKIGDMIKEQLLELAKKRDEKNQQIIARRHAMGIL